MTESIVARTTVVVNVAGFSCLGKSTLLDSFAKKHSEVPVYNYDSFTPSGARPTEPGAWIEFEREMVSCVISHVQKPSTPSFIVLDNFIKKAAMFHQLNRFTNIIVFNIILDFIGDEGEWRALYEKRGRLNISADHRLHSWKSFVRNELVGLPNSFVFRVISLDEADFEERANIAIGLLEKLQKLSLSKQVCVRPKAKAIGNDFIRVHSEKALTRVDARLQEYYFYLLETKIYKNDSFVLTKNDKYKNRYLIWIRLDVDHLAVDASDSFKFSKRLLPHLVPDTFSNPALALEWVKTRKADLDDVLARVPLERKDLFYHFPCSYNVFHFHVVDPAEFIYDYGQIFYPEHAEDLRTFTLDASDLLEILAEPAVKIGGGETSEKAPRVQPVHIKSLAEPFLLAVLTYGDSAILRWLILIFCFLGEDTGGNLPLRILHHALVLFLDPWVLVPYFFSHVIRVANALQPDQHVLSAVYHALLGVYFLTYPSQADVAIASLVRIAYLNFKARSGPRISNAKLFYTLIYVCVVFKYLSSRK